MCFKKRFTFVLCPRVWANSARAEADVVNFKSSGMLRRPRGYAEHAKRSSYGQVTSKTRFGSYFISRVWSGTNALRTARTQGFAFFLDVFVRPFACGMKALQPVLDYY